jgi:hypothetical protein
VNYYKYKITSYTPSTACKQIKITIEYSDGDTKTHYSSVVDYLEELLRSQNDNDVKVLAMKTLKYIQKAYLYFDKTNAKEHAKISTIIEKYKEYDLVFGSMIEENVSTGVIRHAIKSSCFNLSGSVRIKFYLNSGYTGNLSIIFNGTTFEYYVTNGISGGCDFIEVVMPAYLINQKIVISDGVNILEYGINSYATGMNNYDYDLHQLLVAISEYSSAAKLYVESKN